MCGFKGGLRKGLRCTLRHLYAAWAGFACWEGQVKETAGAELENVQLYFVRCCISLVVLKTPSDIHLGLRSHFLFRQSLVAEWPMETQSHSPVGAMGSCEPFR